VLLSPVAKVKELADKVNAAIVAGAFFERGPTSAAFGGRETPQVFLDEITASQVRKMGGERILRRACNQHS
jgi:hypothetical protein